MLAGLDWSVIGVRLADAPAETRARVFDLLEAIEEGALSANSKRMREGGANG